MKQELSFFCSRHQSVFNSRLTVIVVGILFPPGTTCTQFSMLSSRYCKELTLGAHIKSSMVKSNQQAMQ